MVEGVHLRPAARPEGGAADAGGARGVIRPLSRAGRLKADTGMRQRKPRLTGRAIAESSVRKLVPPSQTNIASQKAMDPLQPGTEKSS